MTRFRRLRTTVAGLSAALAMAGSVVAVSAATAGPASAATCNPKTDYEALNYGSAGFWFNWCGTGYRYPNTVFEVRDATAPYHRIWIHNEFGQAWCAWGPNDKDVPFDFNGSGGGGIANVLISANTSSC